MAIRLKKRAKSLILLVLAFLSVFAVFNSTRLGHSFQINYDRELRGIRNISLTANATQTSDHRAGTNVTTGPRRIAVELVGYARLGNLMFGHASMLGMANRSCLEPVTSTRNALLLDSFDLNTPEAKIQSDSSEWRRLEEKYANAYDVSLNERVSHSNSSVLLLGYFQSWRYFDHIRERIVREFTAKAPHAGAANKFIDDALEKHYPGSTKNLTLSRSIIRIGIHVRRGDMLMDVSVNKGYTTAGPEYLKRAMTYLEERLGNDSDIHPLRLLYFVISDNIAWCEAHVKSQYPLVFGFNSAAVDMAILASCNHTIITVGTYGWWAGYLAGGITVYYKDFPRPGSEIATGFIKEDYFHPTWIGLS